MAQGRGWLAWALALGLVALPGCGRLAPLGAQGPQAGRWQARAVESPSALAQRFAEGLRAAGFQGKIQVQGARVLVQLGEQQLSYDFGQSQGEVVVQLGELRLALPVGEILAGLGQVGAGGQGTEVLPVLLVPLATHMALGGAQALGLYWVQHRGEDFDRAEAAKAVLVGMAVAALPVFGDLKGAPGLAVLGTKLVASAGSFEAPALARAALALLPELVAFLRARRAQAKA